MAEAQKPTGRVEIKIGNLSFAAEGDQQWLGEQLTKIMQAAAPAISQNAVDTVEAQNKPAASTAGIVSLASFIKSANAETKQVQRFLATAGWLSRRGVAKLTTAAVASTLAEHHQKRLANPSDCLNQNVSKGYCEKQNDGFFITPEGWKALGLEQ